MTDKQRFKLVDDGYVELDYWGNLDGAIERLQKWNLTHQFIKAFIEFNGHILKSDTVTTDSAYQEVLGCSKDKHERQVEAERQAYLRRKEQHEAAIPTLTKKWMEDGHKILDEKYWDCWDKMVPVRLNDLYEGMELGSCLDIVKELNSGCALDEAKSIINSQNHSGMSFMLVCNMVKVLCDRGQDFVNYIR